MPCADGPGRVAPALAIACDDVTLCRAGRRVIDGFCLHVATGEWVLLRGPNGSGKSTLAALLLGLERADAGRIRVLDAPPRVSRHRVGMLPQHATLRADVPACLRDLVRMGALEGAIWRPGQYRRADAAAAEALDAVGMGWAAARRFETLSGGERRRVLIARALAAGPKLLILDEPLAGVDRDGQTRILDLLDRMRPAVTILMIDHDSSAAARMADRCVALGGGGKARAGETNQPGAQVA